MAYYNRKCNYCGKKYYVCLACEKKGSWKTMCCSRRCYYNFISKNFNNKVEPQIINEGQSKMKAKLKDGNIVNIFGYDLQLGKFDCDDGITRVTDDFEQFIIPESEMESIVNMVYSLE